MAGSRKAKPHSNDFGKMAYLSPSPSGAMESSSMSGDIQSRALERMSAMIRKSLEEELFDLNAADPDCIGQLPKIFEEAVMDSLTNILGEGEAIALSKVVGESGLGEPDTVYSKLDLFLHEGSGILKGAIQEEFRVKVHELFVRTFAQYVSLPEALAVAPVVS